ncbi:MAG: glycine cleavage system aminomethyltransferase GcvT, partial [Chloroflexota bacterium]
AGGARLVEFGGWEMPVQYQGIIAEHTIVRTAAGLFDLSHMGRLRFSGPDALTFVQQLTTNDVSRLTPGRAQYSLCCADHGGVLDDVVVYRLDPEILMVVNASNRVKILGHIERMRSSASWNFTLDDTTSETAMIGLQGPLAAAYLQPLCDIDLASIRYYAGADGRVAGTAAFIARTGYTGEDGFELIIAAADAPGLWSRLQEPRNDVSPRPCGLGARDTLRLEAGMALYGHELNEETTPYEAGLGRVVKLEKEEFSGRSSLLALVGQTPARGLIGFELTSQGVPRQGYAVLEHNARIGTVTSGTMSPSLHIPIGLAYVSNDQPREIGSDIQIDIRGRAAPARVVAVPFYAHRTKRGS